ncbi:N-acetyl sugar amidotransferase [filamentous cyanobacterium CCP3]|nr:N-acetyl sugar amidotransferase [filamentous cyanobacterium CCP3]PSR18724.1 N-acetyl sugar amidotransferase [filamentous cyanobacterium CCP3]
MVSPLEVPLNLRPAASDHQVCTRCVMDTTDPEITFDAEGVCSYCRWFETSVRPAWFPNEIGRAKLESMVEQIKTEGKDQEYDCIIGLSGGVDSSYLAYQAKRLGLRPLAVHVDAGWNSELAVKNIENIVKLLDIDLYTYVVNWEEMQDLQVAFLRSGVANQDVPQDHAFFAALYGFAVQNNIRYVLSGSNLATESILPKAWGYDAMDAQHLKAIHKRFGQRPLQSFPTVSFFDYNINFPFLRRMKVLAPLNYMPYDKQEAMEVLEKELGWRYYGGKHYESRFTKFFQGYYLPTRFGYDKRKAHLSSLIVSGQLSRDAALGELSRDAYPFEQLAEDRAFVLKKLSLAEADFDRLMHAPKYTFRDYPSNYYLTRGYRAMLKLARKAKKILGFS